MFSKRMSLVNHSAGGEKKKNLSQDFFNRGRCNKIVTLMARKIIFMRIENRLKVATLGTPKIKLQYNILGCRADFESG